MHLEPALHHSAADRDRPGVQARALAHERIADCAMLLVIPAHAGIQGCERLVSCATLLYICHGCHTAESRYPVSREPVVPSWTPAIAGVTNGKDFERTTLG